MATNKNKDKAVLNLAWGYLLLKLTIWVNAKHISYFSWLLFLKNVLPMFFFVLSQTGKFSSYFKQLTHYLLGNMSFIMIENAELLTPLLLRLLHKIK